MNRICHDGHTLEISTEPIEITSYSPERDPGWTFTDAAGHDHAAVMDAHHMTVTYPTLVTRSAVREDEFDEDWEPVVDVWWECPRCGEKITAATRLPVGPRFIPGPVSYMIDGLPATREEADRFLSELSETGDH
jgi:hypothetical protein